MIGGVVLSSSTPEKPLRIYTNKQNESGSIAQVPAPSPLRPSVPVSLCYVDNLVKASFTKVQGQYLAFIAAYTKVNGRPPAEADIQRYFKVTPPSVHQMILTLERRGLIARTPRQARSIEILILPECLPALD